MLLVVLHDRCVRKGGFNGDEFVAADHCRLVEEQGRPNLKMPDRSDVLRGSVKDHLKNFRLPEAPCVVDIHNPYLRVIFWAHYILKRRALA